MFDIMNKMIKSIKNDILVICTVAILAFGSQIPTLGFFQDDWNFVFYSSAQGAKGLLNFLTIDGRPGATWVYILGFSIFGYHPALWQFFALALRVLTTIIFLLILHNLWPTRRYGNLIASVFFLTYPFYTLQPLSVAYAPHFAAYAFYCLSVLLMIKAVTKPEKHLQYSILAVLFTFVHLFTVEYFVGLELLRPFILWFVTPIGQEKTRVSKLRTVLIKWLPYLLPLIVFVIWRSVFSSRLGIRNDPLSAVFDSGGIISSVIKNIAADLVLMLVTSWFQIINVDLFVIGPIRNFYIFAISIASGICFYLFSKPARQSIETNTGLREVLLAGSLAIVTGLIAPYSIGYIIHTKIPPWNSRFALPELMGLSLMVSGLIESLVTAKVVRHVFFAILIGLLVGMHNYNTLNFKYAWEKQERLYEQLIWRAPSIEPGTAIVTDQEVLGYMGDYPTSLSINTIYQPKSTNNVPYWFFALSENFNSNIDSFLGTDQLTASRAVLEFSGKRENAIFITYEPENKQCLWVLRPQDADYKYLPGTMKQGAQISNYESIHPQSISTNNYYNQIVKENKNTWCYFYQKADLARQLGDWETVVSLWKEAQSKGYRPDNGFEYIVFIEANAKLGNWEEAFLLTKIANKTTNAMYFILCPTWKRLANETSPQVQKDGFVKDAYRTLKCAP